MEAVPDLIDEPTPTVEPEPTVHKLAKVVLCALAAYAASNLMTRVYDTAVEKVRKTEEDLTELTEED